MTPEPMDEHHLLSILRQEETDASSYYTSELAHVQTDAMERYNANLYGDEVEGRSRFVSQDLENTVQTVMPHIMRMFLENDELLTIEDDKHDITDIEEQVRALLLHIFFRDNPGETICHDFVWDGLVQKLGVVRLSAQPAKPEPARTYENLLPQQAAEFLNNDEYEIQEQSVEFSEELGVELISLKVKRTPKHTEFIIEAIAPEEFAIESRSKSIEDAGYHRLKQEVYIADLVRMFPNKASELDPTGSHSTDDQQDDLDSDPRKQARFDNENYDVDDSDSLENQRRTVDLLTEWIRIDYDGDGIVELRQIQRVGNTILENEKVEHSELVEWTPSRIPHKVYGRSIADQVCDLQKAATVVTRTYFDGLSQSLMPRTIVNEQQLSDPSVMDQIIDRDIADTIPVKGDARTALAEMPTPDVSQSALAALEHIDQQLEQASGVMRAAQGQNADAVTETADGIRRLQAAANGRIELIGQWAAKGVERIFKRLLKLVVQHQDHARTIKINGQPLLIDPRQWSEEMTVSVHVGIAGETREEKFQKLSLIIAKQEQIMIEFAKLGITPDVNPLANMEQYSAALHDMVKVSGMKDGERYFAKIPQGFQLGLPPPGQQQDPKVLEAQARVQLEQQKAAAQADIQQKELAHNATIEKMKEETAKAKVVEQVRVEGDLAALKAGHAQDLKVLQEKHQRELGEMRLNNEVYLAERRQDIEEGLARQREQHRTHEASVASQANGSNGISKNRPGGSLAK